ncbi:hypothetical protein [Streptomyces sp. NPDC058045]|uniref:hypothetical protein n=1 Tax=Streptomyces sp. NPDC058045 TaxID=3346311 RepID=UPI0036ED8FF9
MIGVIVIGGRRPRVPGDVGCAEGFPRPAVFETAEGTSMAQVFAGREAEMLPALCRAGQALLDRGATALVTTCGLLTGLQRGLAERFDVPVATSALLQLPSLLAAAPPGGRIGVVTAVGGLLTPGRLADAGVRPEQGDRITIVDLAASEFVRALKGEREDLDVPSAGREICSAVSAALADEPVGALLSECANLPPYSAALRAATGLPVWDAMDQIRWLADGVAAPGNRGAS